MARDEKSSYYDTGGIETMDIIQAKVPREMNSLLAIPLANILKYACRAGHKGQFERDIEKIGVYAEEIKILIKRGEEI